MIMLLTATLAQLLFDQAINNYDSELSIQSDYPDALYSRGNAYRKKGQFDRAIEDYESALDLKPDWALPREGIRLARRGVRL